jgi:PhnB protein
MMSQGIPAGFHSLNSHLIVSDAAAALDFYKKAFGAVEETCLKNPKNGKIMYAALTIGDSTLMLGEECQEAQMLSPKSLNGLSPVTIHLYIASDVDGVFKQAVDAGAEVLMPLSDMFWGDRYGKLKDPFGHVWALATHIKDVIPAEMQAGMEQCMAQPV